MTGREEPPLSLFNYESDTLRTGPLSSIDSAPKTRSPVKCSKEEAAEYLRTSMDGIYGRVERGQLERCPGVREDLFTKEMLDASVRGRDAKSAPRNTKKRKAV